MNDDHVTVTIRRRCQSQPSIAVSRSSGDRFHAANASASGTDPGGRGVSQFRRSEARRRCGLALAADIDESAACLVVRMQMRFLHRQHGRKAGVRSLQNAAPIVARARQEALGQHFLPTWPAGSIALSGHAGRIDLQPAQQFVVKFDLDRRDRDVLPVSAFVDLVIIGSGIELVFATGALACGHLPASRRLASSATARHRPWQRPRPGRHRSSALK